MAATQACAGEISAVANVLTGISRGDVPGGKAAGILRPPGMRRTTLSTSGFQPQGMPTPILCVRIAGWFCQMENES